MAAPTVAARAFPEAEQKQHRHPHSGLRHRPARHRSGPADYRRRATTLAIDLILAQPRLRQAQVASRMGWTISSLPRPTFSGSGRSTERSMSFRRWACCITSPIPSRAGGCCYRCYGHAASCVSVFIARSAGNPSLPSTNSSPSAAFVPTVDDIRKCRQALIDVDDQDADEGGHGGCRLFQHERMPRRAFPRPGGPSNVADDQSISWSRMTLIFSDLISGLEFLSNTRLRFPQDKATRDLDLWYIFETENPRTFIGMYQFWVQRKS